MRSAGRTESGSTAAAGDDRTGRARIRDAAIARFAADGVAATSVRAIAADAGVSPGLVIHHFGSKDGLRTACDRHVATVIRERKHEAMAAGAGMDPVAAIRQAGEGPPLLPYLARTLADGSPHVSALVDELVDDAVEYMATGVDSGLLTPSEHPRERAVVLVMWQLGALVLREHVSRLLGADLDQPEGMARWSVAAAEILSHGVLAEGYYERVRDALTEATEGGS